MYLCLGFLDANDIRILDRHPVEKTLAGGCANTVGVETDYAEQNVTPVSYSNPIWTVRTHHT